jgi:hypothetical protein
MVNNTLSPSTIDALASSIESSPHFKAVLDELIESLPAAIAESAVDVKEEVTAITLTKLRESLDKMDTRKIAVAVIANERLRGKIKVQIDDLGLGVSERLKADIKEVLTTETNLTRNLLTARREQSRAKRAELKEQFDVLKQKRDTAKLKVDLAWMRFSKLTVAGPSIAVAFLSGAVAIANYFPAIQCDRGDVVCLVRIRPGVYWRE